MDSIRVHGGVELNGRVRIQGSKNASLPVIVASLLTGGISYLENCPRISDVYNMFTILRSLGAVVTIQNDGVSIDSSDLCCKRMPAEAITGMRSSMCLLGALLSRCGEVVMDYPGGCIIGKRPIDFHLKALSMMGAEFEEKDGKLYGKAEKLTGISYEIPIVSVGVTENILLAAVCAEGETRIQNAAREPEIRSLCTFLRKCGAKIDGDGTSQIKVQGVKELHGCERFRIPPDRIVAGTYVFGCIATGGEVFLEEAPFDQMEEVLATASGMGAICVSCPQGLYIKASRRHGLPEKIRTAPYPGFPTDLQSAALVAMLKGEGECEIEETIFENRFRIVDELLFLGAKIEKVSSKIIRVSGVEKLTGTRLQAFELRGGAALILAGLSADGESLVKGCSFVYRGYENICRDLQELGARINCV